VIIYKINIPKVLSENGYNTTCIRKNNLLGERTMQNLRKNNYISLKSLDTICKLLKCDISDLIEYVDDEFINDYKTDNND